MAFKHLKAWLEGVRGKVDRACVEELLLSAEWGVSWIAEKGAWDRQGLGTEADKMGVNALI